MTPSTNASMKRVVRRPAQPRLPVAEVERVVQQRPGCRSRRRGRPAASAPGGCRRRPCRARACRPGSPCRRRPGRRGPRMRSLSVTTISRTSSYGRCASTLGDPIDVVGRDPEAARPAEDVAVLLAGPARPSACRRSAGAPRGAPAGPGRRASRCGPGAPRGRCTARVRRPCGGSCSISRATCSSSVRTRGGRSPRSPKTSRSCSVNAVSLFSSGCASNSCPR